MNSARLHNEHFRVNTRARFVVECRCQDPLRESLLRGVTWKDVFGRTMALFVVDLNDWESNPPGFADVQATVDMSSVIRSR